MGFPTSGDASLSAQQLFNEQELSEDPPFEFDFGTSGSAQADTGSSHRPVNAHDLSNAVGNVAGNAYLTAATTDLAMAVEKTMTARESYADLQLYMPTEAGDLRKPLAVLLRAVGGDYVLGDIMLLPARMRFGLRMAAKLAMEPEDPRISTDVFADAWTHIARGMLEAVHLCEHVQSRCEKRMYDLSLPAGLLTNVLAGKHPCLDRDGNLSVPNWAERRGSKRYPCRVEVDVVSERQTQTGILRNFSAEGLGITGLSGFAMNERVTVKRIDGDDISGCIQRIDEKWTGVLMDKALFFDDPLYGLVGKTKSLPY
ncbi:MAG: PilZ domain-containing protein [Anderseniella sp.]